MGTPHITRQIFDGRMTTAQNIRYEGHIVANVKIWPGPRQEGEPLHDLIYGGNFRNNHDAAIELANLEHPKENTK
jgi:hypothetical protein